MARNFQVVFMLVALSAFTSPFVSSTYYDDFSSWSSWSSWSNTGSSWYNLFGQQRNKNVTTFGGNANGSQCVFPFMYRDIYYYSCTTDGRRDGLRWCASTDSYDNDQQFGFCIEQDVSGPVETSKGSCVFPFIYKRRVYYECTDENSADGEKWCSLNWSYNKEAHKGSCPSTRETFAGNAYGDKCHESYMFEGEYYQGCTTVGRKDGHPWCATTKNYDTDGKWGFCIMEEFEPNILTTDRFFCTFPFIYGDNIYYNCTTDGRTDGRPWCSLTHNYNRDYSYGICEKIWQ